MRVRAGGPGFGSLPSIGDAPLDPPESEEFNNDNAPDYEPEYEKDRGFD